MILYYQLRSTKSRSVYELSRSGMRHYVWAVVWAVFVLFLTTSPIQDITNSRFSFPGIDKLVHTGFFFVFTILMFFGSLKNSDSPHWFSFSAVGNVLIGSFFAIMTEVIQRYLTSYRSFELWDIFADHVGIGMGYFAYLVFVLALRRE